MQTGARPWPKPQPICANHPTSRLQGNRCQAAIGVDTRFDMARALDGFIAR